MSAVKQCPYCASTIAANSNYCPYCAEPQPQQQYQQPQYQQLQNQFQNPSVPSQGYNAKCDSCGSHLSILAGHQQFKCPYCGVVKRIPPSPPPPQVSIPTPSTANALAPAASQSQTVNVNLSMPTERIITGTVVNKIVYVLLAFFLGGIGIHKFYAGKTAAGFLYLIFCWTFIPSLLAFIDFIVGLTKTSDPDGNIVV